MVTAIPTTMLHSSALGVTRSDSPRIGSRAAAKSIMGRARPSPTGVPMAVASTPIPAASARIIPSTFRRLAPIARSMPNWRVRCPTSIANVLLISVVPTSSAIRVKMSRIWAVVAASPSSCSRDRWAS